MKYSILIVNYKTMRDVLLLLQDIWSTFYHLDYEVIIVDNKSGDIFPENLDKTRVIYNNENAGFGKAMNLAARQALGEYLVLINPDCRIPANQDFDAFVEAQRLHNCGVLSSLIRYPDDRVQPNRGGKSNLMTFIFQALRLGRLKSLVPQWFGRLPLVKQSIIGKYLHNFNENIPELEECDWLSGSFMVIKSSIFKEVNGFDENFFMYCEDEDLCLRLASRGYKSIFSSRFLVIHEVGGAQKTKENQRLKFTEIKRLESNIYFLKKHQSYLASLTLRFFYFFLYLFISPRLSVGFLRK